jgi:hypothetical protein
MSYTLNDLTNYEQSLQNSLSQMQISSTGTITTDIDAKNAELIEKQLRQNEQIQEIDEKTKLILTRSRMLQLSQEKNMYKKKIIYTLLSILLFLFIVTLSTYVFFSKKK